MHSNYSPIIGLPPISVGQSLSLVLQICYVNRSMCLSPPSTFSGEIDSLDQDLGWSPSPSPMYLGSRCGRPDPFSSPPRRTPFCAFTCATERPIHNPLECLFSTTCVLTVRPFVCKSPARLATNSARGLEPKQRTEAKRRKRTIKPRGYDGGSFYCGGKCLSV